MVVCIGIQQVCEECFLAATSRCSKQDFEAPVHQRHACLSCSRLHPEAKMSQSPKRDRRQALARMNSAPIPRVPLIDSLSNGVRELRGLGRRSKTSTGFLSTMGQPEQQSTRGARKPSKNPEDLEFICDELRRRRHTTAIAPTSRSCDVSRPGRGLNSRQLMRAHSTSSQMMTRRQDNATELHTSKRGERAASSSYSYNVAGRTAGTAIRNATSSGPKTRKHSMMERRGEPIMQPRGLPGAVSILELSDEPNELELSTVDLRLPKYKANLPAPVMHGRRDDPVNSALTPISVDHLAELDPKPELKHLDSPAKKTEKKAAQLKASSGALRGGSSNRSKTNDHHAEPIDFHLSTVDLRPRPRRHTTPDTTQKLKGYRQGNQEPVVAEGEAQELRGELTPFRRQKSAELVDFHLSTFGFKPRRHTTDAKPDKSKNVGDRLQSRCRIDQMVEANPATPEVTTPTNSKNNKLCDLAYLDTFRSYTV
ncbi:unnamed protein product [Phytophthora fragariaefolia]|uniref:Unnamed protein product n=1 Tax=Phytophthora fragariaefolia TaxID=1490495 RepID=A0A9W6YBN9_9STRA|nr:unnamed protein product [Phytophthora fragariaefolia]